MLVSVSWLKNYVDVPVDTKTLARDLTMLGLNVERVESAGAIDPAVVVGRVLEVRPHPDADRLRVCRVDAGEGPLEIVCGAPNVEAGQLVPVALVGASLPNGLKIRKSKIRGVLSNGMVCSEIELGLGDDAAGIMVLDGDYELGRPFSEIAGSGDDVIEIEVTPNRPDQLNHVGVAREVAALYGVPLRIPSPEIVSTRTDPPCFSVSITDASDCYRFTGRVIRGVKVGPSPSWLRRRLEQIGLKSINNVVDVSNYVMMEMGQPTHAYDLAKLESRRIGVRRARAGETLVCLDEARYRFQGGELLIVDEDDPIGVAGVIGGYATRVTASTSDLLVESAAFDPRSVRRTRKGMNINTDASYRFERGSDREACRAASDRVTELILETAGGEPGEFVDAYPAPHQERRVSIRRAQTRRLLGLALGTDEISRLLGRLHFSATATTDERVTVQVPSFRGDVLEEADLVEEVARLHGYDKIGLGWSFRTTTYGHVDPFDRFVESVADHLCARGHSEVVTSSFCEGGEAEVFGWEGPRAAAVPIINPLSARHRFLRTSLLPGLLEVVRRNMDRGMRRLEVFTIGRVFQRDGEAGLPHERLELLLARTRPEGPDFWNHSRADADLFDLKGELESLGAAHRVDLSGRFTYEFDTRTGRFRYNEERETVIEGGIVPPAAAERYGLDQALWFAVVDLRALFEARAHRATFKPIAEYPPSKRDLSLVTMSGVTYAQIEKTLVKHAGRLLESVQVFDVYTGERLPEGSTAYGVRLCFRSSQGTLRDADVDAVVARVIEKLKNELGVVLRT